LPFLDFHQFKVDSLHKLATHNVETQVEFLEGNGSTLVTGETLQKLQQSIASLEAESIVRNV